MALEITSANFEHEVKKSSLPVVIDVYASWCGPCKQMAPIFEELSKDLDGKVKFVKLNIDDDRDLAVQFNVSSIPTFIFMKAGEMVGKETGAMSKEELKKRIQTHIGI